MRFRRLVLTRPFMLRLPPPRETERQKVERSARAFGLPDDVVAETMRRFDAGEINDEAGQGNLS